MQHSNTDSCILLKFYIKPQPETTIKTIGESCILLKFYIKPQLVASARTACVGCILLKFYIKPQLVSSLFVLGAGCILLKFYIKPQLRLERELAYCVVSYRNSTSNHNYRGFIPILLYVVSYRNSTSNHNEPFASECFCKLYLIEILHQTTTAGIVCHTVSALYLIEILHQTTTAASSGQ